MAAIDVRKLRKMTAGEIRALPHAVEIKSNGVIIGYLTPVKRVSKRRIDQIFDAIDRVAKSRTPEENAAIERAFPDLV